MPDFGYLPLYGDVIWFAASGWGGWLTVRPGSPVVTAIATGQSTPATSVTTQTTLAPLALPPSALPLLPASPLVSVLPSVAPPTVSTSHPSPTWRGSVTATWAAPAARKQAATAPAQAADRSRAVVAPAGVAAVARSADSRMVCQPPDAGPDARPGRTSPASRSSSEAADTQPPAPGCVVADAGGRCRPFRIWISRSGSRPSAIPVRRKYPVSSGTGHGPGCGSEPASRIRSRRQLISGWPVASVASTSQTVSFVPADGKLARASLAGSAARCLGTTAIAAGPEAFGSFLVGPVPTSSVAPGSEVLGWTVAGSGVASTGAVGPAVAGLGTASPDALGLTVAGSVAVVSTVISVARIVTVPSAVRPLKVTDSQPTGASLRCGTHAWTSCSVASLSPALPSSRPGPSVSPD